MTQGVQLILLLLRATPAGISSQDLTNFILSENKRGVCLDLWHSNQIRPPVLPTHGQEGVVLHHYI